MQLSHFSEVTDDGEAAFFMNAIPVYGCRSGPRHPGECYECPALARGPPEAREKVGTNGVSPPHAHAHGFLHKVLLEDLTASG